MKFKVKITQIVTLIIALMSLSSCIFAPFGECIYPPDGKNNEIVEKLFTVRGDGNYTSKTIAGSCGQGAPDSCSNNTVITDSSSPLNYGKWIDAEYTVTAGQSITLSTRGIIATCGGTGLADETGNGLKVVVDAKDPSWTPAQEIDPSSGALGSVQVHSGDYLVITIGQPNGIIINPDGTKGGCGECNKSACMNPTCNRWTTWDDIHYDDDKIAAPWIAPPDPTEDPEKPDKNLNNICSPADWGEKTCWNIKGVGLYFRIEDNRPPAYNLDNMYDVYPLNKQAEKQFENDNKNDNDSPNNTNVIQHITAPKDGKLFFRIRDRRNESGGYGDNMGGYEVYVKNYGCPAINGVANANGEGELEAIIVPDDADPNANPDILSSAAKLANIQGENFTGTSGKVWFRVKSPKPEDYTDNFGHYKVKIKMVVNHGIFSSFIDWVIGLAKKYVLEGSKNIYQNITCTVSSTTTGTGNTIVSYKNCAEFSTILREILVLYVIFVGISFAFGLTQMSQMDLVIKLLKFGLIFQLLSPNSWDFFQNNFFKLFTDGLGNLIGMMTAGAGGSGQSPFAFVDQTMNILILSPTSFIRLLSLITVPLGIIMVPIILYCIFLYLKGILKAILVYIMSLLAIGILFALAPIFIPMILFKATSHLFHQWVRYLARYTIEPLILIVGISILSQLILIAVTRLLGEATCFKCAYNITMNLPIPLFPKNLNLFCLNFYQPWGYDNYGGGKPVLATLVGMFTEIAFFMILVKLMEKYENFSAAVTQFLTQTYMAPGISGKGEMGGYGGVGIASRTAYHASQSTRSIVGMDDKSVSRRAQKNRFDEKAKTALHNSKFQSDQPEEGKKGKIRDSSKSNNKDKGSDRTV